MTMCLYPMPMGVAAKAESLYMRSLRTFAEFEADRQRWYREGDGRPVSEGGRGHRYPYACVHGASAWTDYDNICGPCEDGWGSFDANREAVEAYHIAVSQISEAHRRFNKVKHFVTSERSVPDALQSSLWAWAMETA